MATDEGRQLSDVRVPANFSANSRSRWLCSAGVATLAKICNPASSARCRKFARMPNSSARVESVSAGSNVGPARDAASPARPDCRWQIGRSVPARWFPSRRPRFPTDYTAPCRPSAGPTRPPFSIAGQDWHVSAEHRLFQTTFRYAASCAVMPASAAVRRRLLCDGPSFSLIRKCVCRVACGLVRLPYQKMTTPPGPSLRIVPPRHGPQVQAF